jgi:uncharacterized pyridoxamine 5'-phosphate oxidase family protein
MKKLLLVTAGALLLLSATGANNSNLNDNSPSNNEKSMKEVHDFIRKCGVYFLATADADQPRVRPVGTIAIWDGKLYIQTGKRKNVARQLVENPKIEICAYDAPSGAWLRVEATVAADERREAKQFMLDEYPSLKGMYSADDENTFLLSLSAVTATFYTFSEEPRIVKF